METTSLQHISMGFPSLKLHLFFHVVSLEGKHPRLQFTCFHGMETQVNKWFSIMEDRGKLHGNPRFPEGNIRETTMKPGFPNVKHKGNHMETSRFPM